MPTAEIGIIGGSGFYHLLEAERELTVQTPYGPPSDVISVGELAGRSCAFLPRHGRRHQLPPHRIPYRANLYALKELGATQLIGVCAVGALTTQHGVGEVVFADQLVDFTRGRREETFYDGPITTHVDCGEPYCPRMRAVAIAAAEQLALKFHAEGTIVVTGGPRFSTDAESLFFAAQGWHLENMTQCPEVVLARELTLSYLNISLVTNNHVEARARRGQEAGGAPQVIGVIRERLAQIKQLLAAVAAELPPGPERPAQIRDALKHARWV